MPDFPATTGVPAQQDTDPKFLLTPGGTADPFLKYKDWTGVNHTARLNGGWFVDQAEGGQERLTLSIDYVDAAGVKWTASRVGGEFLHTRTDAPDASFKSADITYRDWSGAVLTARIHNAAPSIAALTVTRKQGPPAADGFFGNPNVSQIATVNDAEDAENSLTVAVVGANPNNGVTVSDLKVDEAGKVTAKVQPSCSAADATFALRVTDSTGQSANATLSVTIIPNSAPVLSYPSATQRVTAGGALTVDPTAGPSDEGRGLSDLPSVGEPILGNATVSPANFTGTIQVAKVALQMVEGNFIRVPIGRVTINNAGPAGTYTVTVPLTDDCGETATATFTLVVDSPPSISAASVTRRQSVPASISTIATVSDDQTSAGSLVVTATGMPAGITVTDLTNSGGNITAKVAASCGASLGANTVGLKVTDGAGLSSTASLIINVTPDQQPPVITLNGADTVTVECHTNFADPGASATDNCAGSVPVSASGGVNANVPGSYTVTYTATDGRNTATRTRTVSVVDTGAPRLTLKPGISLWPPDHGYRTVTVAQMVESVSDGCSTTLGVSSVVIERVTSDEPENAPSDSDGNTKNDIVISADCKSVQLRAERDEARNGRIYIVTLRVRDASGNTTRQEFKASAPIAQGGTAAVQDAPAIMVTSSCP